MTSSVNEKGAYEVLNYSITIDFNENYRNTVIKFSYKYRHRSIFYQILYFPVTVAVVKIRNWKPVGFFPRKFGAPHGWALRKFLKSTSSRTLLIQIKT